MSDWKVYKIGDVCQTISDTYKGNSEYVVLINTSDVLEGKVLNHEFSLNKNLPGQFKKTFRQNDILYSEIRPQNKRFAFIDFNPIDYVASTKLMVLRCNQNLILPEYFYFVISDYRFINKLQLIAETRSGTFPQITFTELANQTFYLPSIEEQKKIVKLLSSIDSRIESNRKINARLEELAQAIFKSWFIDFIPFGGQMPDDWEEKPLINMVEKVKGGDWGKEESMDTYIKRVLCIRGADLNSIKVGEKRNAPTRYILEKNFNQKYLSNHDIIVEISGGSPTQSTGRIAMISSSILDENDNSIICTNFCKALKIKNPYYFYFYYLWNYLYDNKVMFIYENGSNGIKNLNLANLLERENHPIPSKRIALEFYNMVEPIFIKIQNLGKESARLAELRDTLLPKLMSGEIKVSKFSECSENSENSENSEKQ